MCSYILKDVVFLHVPKTGGAWVGKVLWDVVIPLDAPDRPIIMQYHISFEDFKKQYPEHAHKPTFAFVRNPLTRWQSYWRFKCMTGWDPQNLMDVQCRSDDFQTFMTNVLQNYPGRYSQAIKGIVGTEGDHVTHIGRYENLIDDLIDIVTRYYVLDPDRIRACPPVNSSQNSGHKALYTETLYEQVYEAEKYVFERFDYPYVPFDQFQQSGLA